MPKVGVSGVSLSVCVASVPKPPMSRLKSSSAPLRQPESSTDVRIRSSPVADVAAELQASPIVNAPTVARVASGAPSAIVVGGIRVSPLSAAAFSAFAALLAVAAEGTCPSVDSSTSSPVRVSFFTCLPWTAFLLMSFLSTLFFPGSATALPASAATSAISATISAGDGR